MSNFSDGSHYTKCVNAQGETIWIEQSGLTWTGGEAGWRIYNSWNDMNEKGLLTATRDDNTLKIVLSEDEFLLKSRCTRKWSASSYGNSK